ncbi:Dolichyl-diphosphooligosaccharide-protein glycosyltransferase subunit dad1 [Datura stramonium]|uniref:Dolichyl-diphosphooligosaccharide-protein glycosyltransferase subunit dad1 n=1 Tax=Datura stramonium TaxID=4076 RepID=A0ABS8WPF5_DATST|nr:Dolichyl-diphosphooligosaccharide-protein glycosyltransferase subunit dad1 [Datura stramonium]
MRCPNQLFLTNQHFGVVLPNTGQYYSTTLKLNTARRFIRTGNSCHLGSGHCLVINDKDKLGERWPEFQGINNWDGLLDPLDHDLREEILRYGEFVEAAYSCFDFDTSSSTYTTCRYPKGTMLTCCGLGRSGYKVIKNLYATCAVQIPRWMKRIPNLMLPRSSWIGYVVVCDDADEIARLGRRDVVIAYRGTATCSEWLENLRVTLTCLPDDMAPDENREPMVQSGLLSMYTSKIAGHLSLQETIREEIAGILSTYCHESLSITITGHSLGAALATLTAYDITTKFNDGHDLPMVTVLSFGGPRVGNKSFRCHLEKNGTKVLRIVNSDDPITKVPGFVIDDDDVSSREDAALARLPRWLLKCMEDTRWVYAEVGKELKLSSKGNVATCHDLKTYLHLVNNFVSSSTCPLRATAKKVSTLVKFFLRLSTVIFTMKEDRGVLFMTALLEQTPQLYVFLDWDFPFR